eukprot:m.22254 g.22254  ORF g.22254 m.22254 type:complete len:74 (+) comp12648_c0_seq3:324-545(+)
MGYRCPASSPEDLAAIDPRHGPVCGHVQGECPGSKHAGPLQQPRVEDAAHARARHQSLAWLGAHPKPCPASVP